MMKALTIDRHADDLGRVRLTEVEKPVPAAGQLLVRMTASVINPSDFLLVHGGYAKVFRTLIWNREQPELHLLPDGEPLKTAPCTLGTEGVGVVDAVGEGVPENLLGRRVALLAGNAPDSGTWSEYIAVDAGRAMPLPDAIDDAHGAMFFINPMTAYILTRELLRVPRGEYLLQTAAGSALGKMVIRLGRHFGFRTISVVRRSEAVEELRQLGSDHVIATDSEDLFERVAEITGGGVRHVIDCVAGELTSEVLRCLAPRGRLVCYGTLSGKDTPLPVRAMMMSLASVEGFYLFNWMAMQSKRKLAEVMREVCQLVQEGVLGGSAGREFALEDYEAAFAYARGGAGKALFRMRGG